MHHKSCVSRDHLAVVLHYITFTVTAKRYYYGHLTIFTTTAEVAPWTQAGVARGVSLARRPVDTRTTTARRRFCE